MPTEKDIVVITGFGPFGQHKVNASWETVQSLAKLGLDEENVELVTVEIPVIYDQVKKLVPELWKKHKPILMIHVGVSSIAVELTLEQQAHNDGYDRPDNDGVSPASKCCVDGICHQTIVSGIDMHLVCHEVNEADKKVKAVVSNDPGRYLCDFSYFTSLHINHKTSAFVHVPPLNAPYTACEMAEGLQLCVKSMLQQVRQLSK